MKSSVSNSIIPPKAKEGLHFRPAVVLPLLFFLSVGVRFTLAYFFRHGPSVTIDESLYINIAKSLAAGEGIAYRAQPVPYLYILYPLLLTPLYLFPLPFDLYRVIQLYNAILISTSLFPVYLFAKDFSGSKKKALLASLFTLLMPDMQMAGFLMTESLIWPLSLWLIFFAYRLYSAEDHQLLYGVLTGLFTALLFWTKPGALAMGLTLLFAALFLGDKQQKRTCRPAALAGLCTCTVFILLFYVLYTAVFGYELSILGLYSKQLTTISAKWFAAVAEFSLLQLLLFAIACGGVLFLLPYAFFRKYEKQQQLFLSAFTFGLVVTAIGTAALVDMFLWNGSFTNPQLHLRYMAMYVPIMVVFFLSTPVLASENRNKPLAVSLLLMAALTVFPGASVGFVAGESTYIDSLALSAWLKPEFLPHTVGVILTAITVIFLLYISFRAFRGSFSSALKIQVLSFFAFFLLYNNVCGYIACNIHQDLYNYRYDAMQLNTLLEDSSEKILLVTGSYDDPPSYLLEARLRKPQQFVTADALITSLSKTSGIYIPFIPEDENPNVGNHSTPDTDTFIFTTSALPFVELSPSADIRESENSAYTLVHLPDSSSPLLATALSGITLHSLSEDARAKFVVFDDSLYHNGKLTLHLAAAAANGSAELLFENAGSTETISLSENTRTCLLSLKPGETIITALNGDVTIYAYWTN